MTTISKIRIISEIIIAILVLFGGLLAVVDFLETSYNTRSLRFDEPLIAKRDSCSFFIFNASSGERYQLHLFEEDMLSEVVSLDSSETIYRINPRYVRSKYEVCFEWNGTWPDFSNDNSVETYSALFRIFLRRMDFKRMVVYSFKYGPGRISLFSYFKPSYLNTLPNTICFRSEEECAPNDYFISLKSKSMIMRVPDCYWCQDDVIKCFPTTVNIPDTDMKKKNIDVMLGDYEVWEDSTFNICDYRCQFDKIDNRGIFKMALIHNSSLIL